MAAFDLEEQEQLEALKAWWKRWGNYVIYGLSALLIAVAGFQYWRSHTAAQSAEAAAHFESLNNALEAGDNQAAKVQGALLMDKYGSTPYATRAAMLIASLNVQGKDAKSAKAQLEWVIEHTKEIALRDVSRLRLAGLLLDEKNYEGALKQLSASHTDAYGPRFDDLRGDAYLAQGKAAEARAAYAAAHARLKESDPLYGVVGMKLDALGGPAK